ncbi:WXG100 family type VII secretion target [Streptomyces fractus]|uniref:WXG100 family type VII secretion target n=1 Tax=Streptomyces fractus TaxID=641806 RepID=UPI003CE8A36F
MDVEEILKDALMKLGMWWPDADSGQLREAASAWRAFAESVDDVTAATHKSARSIIDGNEGPSIEAFGEFWARYHKGAKSGWLDDLAEAARSIAKALDQYADTVDEAISHLRTEIGIAAAALGAGILLAIVTGGAGAVAGSAAAEGVIAASASVGVTVSAEIAGVIGTTMTGVAFGAIESIAVDLAVAQPLHIAAGDQEGLSLDHAREAGVGGAVLGGALVGAGSSAAAIKNAGGIRTVLNSIDIPALNMAGPRLATPSGADSSGVLLSEGGGALRDATARYPVGRRGTNEDTSFKSPDASDKTRNKGNREVKVAQSEGRTARNEPTTIQGRVYAGHALDQMQTRGIPPTVVEDTVRNGESVTGKVAGTTAHYNFDERITIITDTETGRVVTVAGGIIKQ